MCSRFYLGFRSIETYLFYSVLLGNLQDLLFEAKDV